jgi:DNA-directed RNA polymerase subunit RPC12/RpoP
MEEFEEIYLSGGTFEFKKGLNGGVSIGYKSSNPWPLSIFQVRVSYEGKVLDIVDFGGIGQVIPYPKPSLLAWVLSDRHGMFGRRCPDCESYFRTNSCGSDKVCPYCGYRGESIQFLTKNQLEYIGKLCNSFIEAHNGDEDVILNLDELAKELPENQPKWFYKEEKQQNSYSCSDCRTRFDILGEYGLCPKCGKANYHEVFEKKMSKLKSQFEEANNALTDQHDRKVEWEKLTRCVSDFESMANQLRSLLLKLPAIPKRKGDIRSLSFQRVINAAERLNEWYGFDFLEELAEDDKNFLNRMFNRRHLFTHNAGRVDQKYIDNTGDNSVKLNEGLHVRSREIRRLISLVSGAGQKLIQGYEAIQ